MNAQLNLPDSMIESIAKEAGMSKLEIQGVIGLINKRLPSQREVAERQRRYDEDERMGRFDI
jgi:hypothetical protein